MIIVGDTDLAARLPAQASQLYGTNLVNLLKLLVPEKDGRLVLDLDDVVVRGVTVTHHGEVLWPPPPISVSRGGRERRQRAGRAGGVDARWRRPRSRPRRPGATR